MSIFSDAVDFVEENIVEPVGDFVEENIVEPVVDLFTDASVSIQGTSANEVLDALNYSDSGNDYIDGWTGNDTIYGWSGDDTLLGYDGDDVIYGEAGNDKLYGEYGYDTLSGGSGADTFVLGESYQVYDQGAGYDTITDFNWAEGDKIQVIGQLSDYSLSQYGQGMDIFYQSDLIAHVENTTDVVASLDFIFV